MFCEVLDLLQIDVLSTGNNGKEAVELYEKYKPDIVFTDLMMPNYDGMYAIENIKDKNPSSKIIMITGESTSANPFLLDSLKVRVILKPFNIEMIKTAIMEILSMDTSPSKLKIQYQFEKDNNIYSCFVTYDQYRNFNNLPIIQNCEIIGTDIESSESYFDEIQKAVEMAAQDEEGPIRRLSEIVTED